MVSAPNHVLDVSPGGGLIQGFSNSNKFGHSKKLKRVMTTMDSTKQ